MKIADPTVNPWFYCLASHRWISDFQSGLINSKQIPKNVKFGLHADINMENKMNGSDRLFGFWKIKNGVAALRAKCLWKHISLPLSLSLYIYIGGFQCLIFIIPHHTSYFMSSFLKSKLSIRTVQYNIYTKICMEMKFYIF